MGSLAAVSSELCSNMFQSVPQRRRQFGEFALDEVFTTNQDVPPKSDLSHGVNSTHDLFSRAVHLQPPSFRYHGTKTPATLFLLPCQIPDLP